MGVRIMKYPYTEEERNQVMMNFMKEGKVTAIPAKEKKKYILLDQFIKRLDAGKMYSEQEINNELLSIYSLKDYVEQRRYLIMFGFMKRTLDGAKYWLIQEDRSENEEHKFLK